MSTAEETQPQVHTDTRPTISGKDFARALGTFGISTIFRTGSLVWQHGLNEDVFSQHVPESVEAIGSQICSAKAEQLAVHEAIISVREFVSKVVS